MTVAEYKAAKLACGNRLLACGERNSANYAAMLTAWTNWTPPTATVYLDSGPGFE